MSTRVLEPLVRHLLISLALFFALVWPTTLLTQHLWAPFDLSRSETLTQHGRMLVATIDADIGDRYEVRFRDRLVPLDSGRFYALAEHGSLTAQIGQFSLVKNWNLPDDFPSKAYPEGTWCHITEWTVKYNALNTQFGRYEPACTEVRASK